MFTCGEPSVYGLKHITKIKRLTLYILDVCLHDASVHQAGRIGPANFIGMSVRSRVSVQFIH